METFQSVLRQLLILPEEERKLRFKWMEDNRPEAFKQFSLYIKQNPGVIHEAMGCEHWLRKMGPQTFTRPFAPIQHRVLDWNWNCLMKIQEKVPLDPREMVGFLPHPRETGKSSIVEWLCIQEGAILKTGYVIYLCHEKGTLIYDPSRPDLGWIPVEHHPSAQEVIRLSVRVELVGLPKAHAEFVTPEHRYWARRIASRQVKHIRQDTRYGKAHWVEAQHLDWNTWIGYPIDYSIYPESNYPLLTKWKGSWRGGKYLQVEFPLFKNPEFWWVVGLWWGDGTLGGPKRGNIAFSCGDAHPEIKDYLVMLLKEWGYPVLQRRPKNGSRVTDVIFTDRSLSQWLGTWKRGRNRKEPPAWVEQLPFEHQRQLIRGYLAADAYVSERSVKLTSIHLPGLMAVRRMLMRLGVTCTIANKRHLISFQTFPGGRMYPVAPSFTLDIDRPDLLGLEGVNQRPNKDLLALFIEDGFLWSRVRDAEPDAERTFVPITTDDKTYITAFGRSHNCSKLSQAVDHVVAIRDRIESEHVAEMYKGLGKPKLGTHGNKFGWGQEFLMTSGGWAIRPVGADVAMRGGKSLNVRPSLIVIDDYDELGDSPHVVEHKEHMLTRAILPMGNANTRVLVPQNPIHANSVVNRMLTGASLALALKTVFGEINEDGSLSNRPVPAVKGLVYEIRQSDEGPWAEITQGESLWPGITRENWQSTLNRVGPEAFEAEFQHNLEVNQEERVLPEYDDRNLLLHVISWDMFEKIYGLRRIPPDWSCDLGVDLGYTQQHLSSWSFLARVPEGYPLAGSVFRYRGRNFKTVSVDDQSVAIRNEMWPDERIEKQTISHEQLGARLLLARKHGWTFHPCDSSKESGWNSWRHYLKPDRSQPHPFHTDQRDENTGLWKLGRPAFFDVVVHKQLRGPIDDYGLKIHRDSAFNQRRRPVKLTESGFTQDQPIKAGDDPNDSTRQIFANTSFLARGKALSQFQKVQAAIPQGYHVAELAQRTDLDPTRKHLTGEMALWFANRAVKKPVIQRDEFGQPLR